MRWTRDVLGIIATINALALTAASAWEQNHWRIREAASRAEAGAITLTEEETIAKRSREKQEAFRPYLPARKLPSRAQDTQEGAI